MSTRPIPTDSQPPSIDDGQLALLICGAAAWMQRDLMHVIDLLDTQCQMMRAMIDGLPRLARADRERLAILAHRIERQRLETLALIVPLIPCAAGIGNWSPPSGRIRPPESTADRPLIRTSLRWPYASRTRIPAWDRPA